MVTKLQYEDPESLGKEEGFGKGEGVCISLERENKIDL